MELSYDAEKFIALVKPKEVIWNYKSPVYNDKEQRRQEWIDVCKEMVPHFDDKTSAAQQAIVISFQRQWKVLRDGFLRSLKNIKKKGSFAKPYTYHKALQFMTELYDNDVEKDKKNGDSSDATSESETVSPDVVPVVKRRPKRRKVEKQVRRQQVAETTKEEIEPEAPTPTPTAEEALFDKIAYFIENEERTKQNIDNDEDKLFLLSLLSDFKSIPETHKLDAKFDILNVLRHYRNIGGSSKGSGSKKSKNMTVCSMTAIKSPEFCYVKCEDDESEEN